jgi:hypothetical protein
MHYFAADHCLVVNLRLLGGYRDDHWGHVLVSGLSRYEYDRGRFGVSVDSILDRVLARALGAEIDDSDRNGPKLLAVAIKLADQVIGEGFEIVIRFIDGSAIRINADHSWEC